MMENEYMEFSEKTLDDCITAACRKFSVTSENLEYEVTDQGSSGFMGFNSRNAVIRARVRGNAHGVTAASGDVLGNVHEEDADKKETDSYGPDDSYRSYESYGSYGSYDGTSRYGEAAGAESKETSDYAPGDDAGYDEAKADTSSYNRNYSGSDFTRSSGKSSRGSYGSSRNGSSYGSSYGKSGRGGQNRSRGNRSGSDRYYAEKSYSDRGDRSYGGRNDRGYSRGDRRGRYDRGEVDVDYTEAYAAAAAAAAAAQKKPEEPKVVYTQEQISGFKEKADAFLNPMFHAMGMEVEISYDFDEKENILTIDFEGDEMGVLIGKRGQTLDSIQYLASLVVNKDVPGYVHVKADTENYRARRRKTLENLARNMASKVKRTHRAQALEPMNPYERRIIHSALQGDRYVTTYSEGEDPYRRVVIIPKEGQ